MDNELLRKLQHLVISNDICIVFVAHLSKAVQAWKVCVPSQVPCVRIPLSVIINYFVTKNDVFLLNKKNRKFIHNGPDYSYLSTLF